MRVRFAPSPTGHLHVGNARTALFNWLLARGHGGTFILRIEDTDSERSTAESERGILADLRWMGLEWDEGPDVGGAFGPYRQSERFALYMSHARELIDKRDAYYCFCSADTLEAQRKAALADGRAPMYAGTCRNLEPAEAERRMAAGERAVIRFRVPDAGEVRFDDAVRGEVVFSMEVIGDFVLVRSDGRPAYNFAVVVDDALMQVTQVIRGEDHISNTPRQVLLYEAMGMEPPAFAHLSLVLGPDHAPLSKRHGATSVAEFRAKGYLPESLVNYLALIGWSPKNRDGVALPDGEELVHEELLPVDEMARRFSLEHVSHSAGVFDEAKLAWMNRHYMKQAAPERLAHECWTWLAERGWVLERTAPAQQFVASLMPMAAGSVDRLDEVADRVRVIFDWDAARAAALVAADPDGAKVVDAFVAETAGAPIADKEAFRAVMARVKERTGIKGKGLFHPVRVALTGAESGPELDLAVPAIDRGAQLPASAGVKPIVSCHDRARRAVSREP
ncbi:MAG: glutamate--tRNA ligase [Acidobacteriota bacterium]|nr:glutamate--tRNA ligase [Acidobacteriota bacterium]